MPLKPRRVRCACCRCPAVATVADLWASGWVAVVMLAANPWRLVLCPNCREG